MYVLPWLVATVAGRTTTVAPRCNEQTGADVVVPVCRSIQGPMLAGMAKVCTRVNSLSHAERTEVIKLIAAGREGGGAVELPGRLRTRVSLWAREVVSTRT